VRSVRIRAVTAGLDPNGDSAEALAARLSSFYDKAQQVFDSAGLPVQTRRLTLPLVRAEDHVTRFSLCNQMATLTRAAELAGVRWTCLPFVMSSRARAEEMRLAALEIIRRFPRTFLHFVVAERGMIYHDALSEVAQAILDISRLSPNGFDNFRVGAGCNIAPNTPFFPFSYHQGQPAFSLAVEVLDEVLASLERLPAEADIDVKREAVCEALREIVGTIDRLGQEIEASSALEYRGLDISLAPYPDRRRSIAVLFALMGLESPGHAGTLAVTSFFTNILKTVLRSTKVRATGFNGVMFSPLEDTGLADANNARLLSVDKLLQWSTVCGCGIDMVPLAGNTLREELAALILDTAAVSAVLQKPLGVRVLPIPGHEVNELTNFNHDFLINTRILPLPGQNLPLGASKNGAFHYLSAVQGG
jgi:uncharacterized protein